MAIADELRSIADEANDNRAEIKSKQYFEQVIEDCKRSARLGSYETQLEERRYNELYGVPGRNIARLIKDKLEKMLNAEGIELIGREPDMFSSIVYYANFSGK